MATFLNNNAWLFKIFTWL